MNAFPNFVRFVVGVISTIMLIVTLIRWAIPFSTVEEVLPVTGYAAVNLLAVIALELWAMNLHILPTAKSKTPNEDKKPL
jgi:hypothetical protein